MPYEFTPWHELSRYKTYKTWPQIINYYSKILPAGEPMLRLVERIAASRYASSLYPVTSMFTLIVGQSEVWYRNHEVLHIDCTEGFMFTFWENPYVKPWVTHSSREAGFQRFERCMAVKNWFMEYTPAELYPHPRPLI